MQLSMTLSIAFFFDINRSLCLFNISCDNLLSRSSADIRFFSLFLIALTHCSTDSMIILLASVVEPSNMPFWELTWFNLASNSAVEEEQDLSIPRNLLLT